MSVLRAGIQMGHSAYALVNRVPLRANSSSVGVKIEGWLAEPNSAAGQ